MDEGTTVTLDGSASFDADNDALTYAWAAPSGVALSDTNGIDPTFTAPTVSTTTVYTFSLVVNDNTANSANTSTVTITVNPLPESTSAGDLPFTAATFGEDANRLAKWQHSQNGIEIEIHYKSEETSTSYNQAIRKLILTSAGTAAVDIVNTPNWALFTTAAQLDRAYHVGTDGSTLVATGASDLFSIAVNNGSSWEIDIAQQGNNRGRLTLTDSFTSTSNWSFIDDIEIATTDTGTGTGGGDQSAYKVIKMVTAVTAAEGGNAAFTVRAVSAIEYRWKKDLDGQEEVVTNVSFPTLDWVEFPFYVVNASQAVNVTVKQSKITKGQNTFHMADGSGNGGGAAVEAPTLYLYRGKSYTFSFSGFATATHPFYLSTTGPSNWVVGIKNSEYSSGVTSASDSLVFNVPSDAPDVLYYHCANHAGMGGKIEIYTPGEVLVLQNVASGSIKPDYICEIKTSDDGWDWAGNGELSVTSDRFGRITGRLEDSAGTFVDGWFEVFDEHWDWIDLWEFGGWSFDTKGNTYSLDLPKGKYKVMFHPNEPAYSESFYDGATDFEAGTLIKVDTNRLTDGIDFILTKQPIGTISGNLTDAGTGSPITSDVEFQVFKANAQGKPINSWPDYYLWLGSGDIDSGTGAYSLSLPSGDYIMRVKVWADYDGAAESIPFDTVYYNGVTSKSEASVVTVVEGQPKSLINFSMTRAKFATITGSVVDENDQILAGWVNVDLFSVPDTGKITEENIWDYFAEPIEMFYDQGTGQYKVKVAPGTYVLGVGGDSNGTYYRQQFYNGVYQPKKSDKDYARCRFLHG